ncbi:MAG: hypothetical protein NTW86_21440 [Candidatus Sumerlaeota bacterium]|nr:hypothetical protein [Candidatus Sumerlaeota bacterium]
MRTRRFSILGSLATVLVFVAPRCHAQTPEHYTNPAAHGYICEQAMAIWPPAGHPALNEFTTYESQILQGAVDEEGSSSLHYWDPDNGYSAGAGAESNVQHAQDLWYEATQDYFANNKTNAYRTLGKLAHLLADLTVPSHALRVLPTWPQYYGSLETWCAGPASKLLGNIKKYKSTGLSVIPNVPSLSLQPAGCQFNYNTLPPAQKTDLLRLWLDCAESTDNYDSDDANGETQKGKVRGYTFQLSDATRDIFWVKAYDFYGGAQLIDTSQYGLMESVPPRRLVLLQSACANLLALGYITLEVTYYPGNVGDSEYFSLTGTLYPGISDANAATQAAALVPSAFQHVATLYKMFWEYQNRPPKLTSIGDNGGGIAFLRWNDPVETPSQYYGIAYDLYTFYWVERAPGGSMWYAYAPNYRLGLMDIGFTGAYFIWITAMYPDGMWYPCYNPAAYPQYSGTPHTPRNLTGSDIGAGYVRLQWDPEIYGTWHYQIIAFREGTGFVPTTGPSGANQFWHFVDYGGAAYAPGTASFMNGWAELVTPQNGEYWFYLRAVGWPAPNTSGGYALVHVSVASNWG